MGGERERFTKRTRRILSYAQTNAEIVGPTQIMPCHMLLALVQDRDTVSYRVMADLGISVKDVIEQIQAVYPRSPSAIEHPELAQETKRVLENCVDEARRMEHPLIGSEHLLLGLVRAPDLATKAVFDSKHLRPNVVRQQVIAVLQSNSNIEELDVEDSQPNTSERETYRSAKLSSPKSDWWFRFTARLMELIAIRPMPVEAPSTDKTIPKAAQPNSLLEADIISITSLLDNLPDHPSAATLYHKRGIAHLWLGHYEDSVGDLTKAIERNPTQISNYLARLVVYELEGKLDLALKDCDTLVKIAPDDNLAHYSRASIYAQQHEFAKAEADIESAFQLSRNEAIYALGMAEIAYHKNDYANAVQHYRRVLLLNPVGHAFNMGVIHYQLGKSFEHSGHTANAIEAFESALNQWSLPPLKRPQGWIAEMKAYLEQHSR
ncbi:MAG: tetratricopeptide repeat protein [Anaerolineae bacterium]|nr:tetratricopeptide repeat protein [Anaerolineae bacterium]